MFPAPRDDALEDNDPTGSPVAIGRSAKRFVRADQRNLQENGLGQQDPVPGIAMLNRKSRRAPGNVRADREQGKSQARQGVGHVIRHSLKDAVAGAQSPRVATLEVDFIDAGRADEDGLAGVDEADGGFTAARVVQQGPDENLSVQQRRSQR